MVAVHRTNPVVVEQVHGKLVIASGEAFPDQLLSVLRVGDRDQDVADRGIVLIRPCAVFQAADDAANGWTDTRKWLSAMALNRQRRGRAHAVEQQPSA